MAALSSPTGLMLVLCWSLRLRYLVTPEIPDSVSGSVREAFKILQEALWSQQMCRS